MSSKRVSWLTAVIVLFGLQLIAEAKPSAVVVAVSKTNTPASKALKVVELMYRNGVRKKATTVKDDNYDGKSRTVSFIEGGMFYTFWYDSASSDGKPLLSIWVRKEGTRGQNALTTFSDLGIDGTVEFGVAGPRRFKLEKSPENQGYFQRRYNLAIAAALRHLQ